MRQVLLNLVWISGIGCVVASARSAWFRVPTAVVLTPRGDWESIQVGVSEIETVFKVAVLGLLLCASLLHWLTPHHEKRAVFVAALSFCVCLFFPYCQTAREPHLAAQAASLHLQHENLTWLGGDIFRNQEHERTPQQTQLYVTDSPRQVSVLPTPTWSLRQLSLGRLPALFDWLGFTNAFCQFVGWGWILAVSGTCMFLISLVSDQPRQEMELWRLAIGTTLVICGLSLLMAWSAPLRAGMILNRAASLTSCGDHAAAVVELERAASAWPPLSEDTDFIVQHGINDLAGNQSSFYAELYQARLLERDGQGDRAIHVYRRLMDSESLESPIRREACRGALRFAERAANAGQWHQALSGTMLVLQRDPCNIKALYMALVCSMQLGDAVAAKTMNERLQTVYHFLNYPNKHIVLGKAREMTVKTLLQRNQSNEAFQQYSALWRLTAQSPVGLVRP